MSTKLNIVNTVENSAKKTIVFLVLIGLAGLSLRLIYFPYDVPLFGDSQGYFWYAIDMSILKEFPSGHSLVNNGWPSFLSIIFQLMDSNNFLDYHNMQRFVTVAFSVATIFSVYLLCNRFFKKSYSLIGAALIAFEPKLLQNSLLGLPESCYVFLIATLLWLYLSNDIKKIYLSFAVAGLLTLVRYEGLLIIIPISIMFLIRFRNNKKNLKKYIICICIFILIILPMGYIRNETMGERHDGIVSHIVAGPHYYQAAETVHGTTIGELLYLGSINFIKYIGWAQIPSFIIFVPLGIILIFKKMDYKKSTIVFTLIAMLIPAFYAYSRDLHEIKYFFALYPIFCVLACFTFRIFLEKFYRKNLIFCIIIGGIILVSVIFVEWNSIDNEHLRESYEILIDLEQKEMKINKEFGRYEGEFLYFHWLRIQNAENFPNLMKELPESKVTYTSRYEGMTAYDLDNLRDYFQFSDRQKITHLILDKYGDARLQHELSLHLLDIFNHENKYPFLIKEYDSKENGFDYHIKLFKIDYDLYAEWINEN